jgi:multisubunit Na+/H+ antiporter MnhB subunit
MIVAMKFLICVLGLALMFTAWLIAFRYASRKKLWIDRHNFAVMVGMITGTLLIALALLLDYLGWWFPH